jgi:hypothetical protein
MSRRRRIPEWGDVAASLVAELLGLSLIDFEAWRPALRERGFPEPDPTSALFCIEAVDRWGPLLKSRHLAPPGALSNPYGRRVCAAQDRNYLAPTPASPTPPRSRRSTRHGRTKYEWIAGTEPSPTPRRLPQKHAPKGSAGRCLSCSACTPRRSDQRPITADWLALMRQDCSGFHKIGL